MAGDSTQRKCSDESTHNVEIAKQMTFTDENAKQKKIRSGVKALVMFDKLQVQLDIRKGHAQTVAKALAWLESSTLEDVTICDAGCGTGSLAIPLALKVATRCDHGSLQFN